ncbi:MAG: bifunctional 4-hydroxy-3-methylbut-2-enyl diphosphate reductase/30S ribosomal protein S1 [Bacillota bacterium]
MKITLANHAGFCFGVRRAVDIAGKIAEAGGGHSLGPVIHNRHVVEALAANGVSPVANLDEVKDGTVLFPSHGVAPAVYAEAERRGLAVRDATCPLVGKAQRAARRLLAQGYTVVVVGDPAHAEVQSIVGWTGGKAVVIGGPEDVRDLPPLERVGVLSQTTQPASVLEGVVAALREKAAEVSIEPTICQVTTERQAEAMELAGQAQVVLVVGGKHSANTRQLVQISRDQGARTYHVESAAEIESAWFSGVDSVAILAGASTPDWITEEVVAKMKELNDKEPEQGQEETKKPEDTAAEDEGRAQMEEALKTLRNGEVVRGRVVSVTDEGIAVDVGYKSEGMIPLSELGLKENQTPDQVIKVGDEINVVVKNVEGPDGNVILSKRRADEEDAWKHLQAVQESGEAIEVPVVAEVKGGLIVDAGVRGFIPASHVSRGFVKDLKPFVGQRLKVRVIELDRPRNQVILSRKLILEEEQRRLREETWQNIVEGEIRTGTVKRLADFGAFVDLGGVDGLLHVSELSYGRVKHPSEVVKEGQEIEVKVRKVDRENERISLGYKETLPDPWKEVAGRYPEGAIVQGKVVRLAPFGAFVELEPGIDGLVHISQLADRRVAKPEDVVTPGQEVKVKVLGVNPEAHRISLSLREAEEHGHDREESRPAQGETTGGGGGGQAGNEGGGGLATLGDVFNDLFKGKGEADKGR